jgi:hypothetical protein
MFPGKVSHRLSGWKRRNGPNDQHSLALIWPVADNVRIRTCSASRRIGLLGTILQLGTGRNVVVSGKPRAADLSYKAIRRLLENAAIVAESA